jgi:EAL domain-containing protein (putative c-di-GMP-specific phosphodiesterase class I)
VRSGEDVAIVRAIVMFAKALGLSVTGEGVEERPQAMQLKALGCDRAQGYYFARPAPPEDVGKLIMPEAAREVFSAA